jgi:lambda family phage portal protein
MTGRLKMRATILDRALAYLAPATARDRVMARYQFDALTGGRGQYDGARRDRRSMRGWSGAEASPDAALVGDLSDLRWRSRDLDRNAPLARGVVNTITGSAVGTGLVPKPRVDWRFLGLDQERAAEVEGEIAREWSLWANSPESDLARGVPFAEKQDLALRGVLVAGDIFSPIRYRETPGAIYGLRCQLVEGERVDNPRGVRSGAQIDNGNRLVAGVEVDADGAAVAYHFRDRYSMMDRAARVGAPVGDGEFRRVPVFAADGRRLVLHLAAPMRPEQTRGEPILAPVIEALRQISDYTDAELSAAVVSSLFTVFVKSGSGQGMKSAPTSGSQTAREENEEIALGKGAVIDLAEGDDVTFANPGRPNVAFDPFVMAILRQVGVAVELPFDVLVKHFTNSYSASRASLLEAWRMYRRRRAWLAARFCQPYYEALLYEAVVRGRLDLPGFLDDPARRAAWCHALWRGPAPGQVDPEREVNAAIKRIEARLSTRSREAAELVGEDWDGTEDQLKAEERRISELPAGGAGAVDGAPDAAADRFDREEEE